MNIQLLLNEVDEPQDSCGEIPSPHPSPLLLSYSKHVKSELPSPTRTPLQKYSLVDETHTCGSPSSYLVSPALTIQSSSTGCLPPPTAETVVVIACLALQQLPVLTLPPAATSLVAFTMPVRHGPKTDAVKETIFACSFPGCGSTFTRKQNMKSHMTTHSDDRPHRCNQCKSGFRRRQELLRHQRTVHPPSGVKQFSCRVCCGSFARADALKRHILSNGGSCTPGDERPPKCHPRSLTL